MAATTTKGRGNTHKQNMARKGEVLTRLRDQFSRANIALVTDYRGTDKGMTVKDISLLRKRLREVKAEYFVVKNTLARRVANEMGITALDDALNNPTAIVFGYGDAVQATKALMDFIKEKKAPKGEALPIVKAGVMGKEVLGKAEIQALAALPSREEIYGKLLGVLIAPARNLMGILNEPGRRMATVLGEYSKKES